MFIKRYVSILIPIGITVSFLLLPIPKELTHETWCFLGIFLVVISGLILEPIPSALIGLIGVFSIAMLGLMGKTPDENIQWALSGFSNSIVWLIVTICMFAVGYQKTGLGKRLSLFLIKYLGKSSLGLGYTIAFADLILTPVIPSNTARSGGIIYPIVINIPTLCNSSPTYKRRKIGAYITWVSISTTCISSAIFLMVLTPYMLMISSASNTMDITISLDAWLHVSLFLLFPLFLLTPFLVYVIYPPERKNVPEASYWALNELQKIGKISFKEIIMGVFTLLIVCVWFFAKRFDISIISILTLILGMMIVMRIISWDDIIGNKSLWNIYIWFATLITLASGFQTKEIIQWLVNHVEVFLITLSPQMVMILLLIVFFVLHYFFASLIAHISLLFSPFLLIASKFVTSDQLNMFIIFLCSSIGLMGILTPYSMGPSAIWYAKGYVTPKEWWCLGALFGLIFISVLVLGILLFI